MQDTEATRVCGHCGELKPREAFASKSLGSGEPQWQCRECHAAYRRAHYVRNRAGYIKRESARIQARSIAVRSRVFEYLLKHPCVDCGETDPVVLEFDHVDRLGKRAPVAFLAARRSWTSVQEEIAKTVVRCVNCHRRVTARQFGWRKADARRG